MRMTPEEARDDLEWAQALARNEAGGGDWEDTFETLARAMETIASMTEEWGVEDRWGYVKWFNPQNLGASPERGRRIAENLAAKDDDYHLVRRWVTRAELIEDD